MNLEASEEVGEFDSSIDYIPVLLKLLTRSEAKEVFF